MSGNIIADLVQARVALWRARKAKDEAAIRAAEEYVDLLLEVIIERNAEW